MCEAEGLEDLSPAAKLVYRVLEEIGPATRREIQDEAMLARRSTARALTTLADAGYAKEVGTADAERPSYDVVDWGDER